MYVGESDGRWLASILRPGGPGRDLPTLPSFLPCLPACLLASDLPCISTSLLWPLSISPSHFGSRSFRYRYARPTVPYVYPIGNLLTFFHRVPWICYVFLLRVPAWSRLCRLREKSVGKSSQGFEIRCTLTAWPLRRCTRVYALSRYTRSSA